LHGADEEKESVFKSMARAACSLAALTVALGLAACADRDTTDLAVSTQSLTSGGVRLALQAGDRTINTVTAVLEGKNGFETQTHEIDVQGNNGVISLFLGDLPVGRGYRITLTAADCTGSASFNVSANEIALVNVPLTCGGSAAVATGSAQVTGSIEGASSAPACNHVQKVVAAPSVQAGDGPVSRLSVFLGAGITPTAIQWTFASTNGAMGTIGELSGAADTDVTFDCSSSGSVRVSAAVTAPSNGSPCTETVRVDISCVNQGGPSLPNSVCGNGVIENGAAFGGLDEVCDTNGSGPDVLPTGSPVGSTCNATCTAVIPPAPNPPTPVCGDGVIQAPEVCDTNGTGPDVLPPGSPAAAICNPTCSAVIPANNPPPDPGTCLTCARANCPSQYEAAIGTGSDAANLAAVTSLFDCVIGSNWEAGGPIPATSCFFKDPTQRLGSLLPCYCGATPQATCLATGPAAADRAAACSAQVEAASLCNPITASCVTGSGSNPAVPLGDALQLLNCERAGCASECGFPAAPEE
jgi:hypothetical protein